MLGDADPAIGHGKERQDDQRSGHRPGSLLGMFGFLRARLAEEGQCDLAHGVEGGQEGCDCESDKDDDVTMTERIRQDFILRPEARGDERETGKRKAADQERPECDRHLLAQAAHVEHILRIDFVLPVCRTPCSMP